MIILNGNDLTISQVVRVSKNRVKVKLSEGARRKIIQSRKKVEDMMKEGETIYGVNTGFGDLVNIRIGEKERKQLQLNLLRSHSSGYGDPMDENTVRAMILVRANALAKGYSGVRVEIIDFLIRLLNESIYPYIPEKGSVGSSGDLSPLAHLALLIFGEGHIIRNGKIVESMEVFKEMRIEPLEIEEKEGISLINGTSYMLANLTLGYEESRNIIKNSILSSALSMHSLSGTRNALFHGLFEARPYGEQAVIASNVSALLEGSKNCDNGTRGKVQDAYSIRCIPTVIGSVLQVLEYVENVLRIELNSATDNPLVFDKIISGCNFHGEPLAFAADFLGIAMTELGNMAERRVFRLTDKNLSGLNAFLAENPGLESGMMIPQYVAASLCNENKVLVYPSSADTIPTSADQEDHVSMGATSTRKLRKIIENVKGIIAIEMLVNHRAMKMYGHDGKYISLIYQKLEDMIGDTKGDAETTFIIKNIADAIDHESLLENLPVQLD